MDTRRQRSQGRVQLPPRRRRPATGPQTLHQLPRPLPAHARCPQETRAPPETKQLFRKGGQVLIKDKPDTCPVCAGSGFNGQIGLFAIHTLDPEDRNLIRANNVEGLKASFRQKKQQSIQTSGLQRVMLGDTSVEELVRVIQGPAESKKKKPSPTEQSAGAAS